MDNPPLPRPIILSDTATLEGRLLILSFLFMGINLAALAVVRGFRISDWLMLLVWSIAAGGAVLILDRYLPKRDPLIFPITMFLTGWGLVMIDRLSDGFIYNFADRQTLWMVFGVIAMLVMATRPEPLVWLREYRYITLIGGLLLLLSTILFGTNPSGFSYAPQLWLGANGIYFQPSELLKIVLVGFLASYLAEQYPALRAIGIQPRNDIVMFSPRILGPILLMWGLCIVILVWQRDLGAAAIFFGVFILLLYMTSGQPLVLVSGLGLMIIAGISAYFVFDVVQARVDIWLDPWSQADSGAFQVVQSLIAFGEGGVFGRGIGQGAPNYIPVVHSDFVFAAIAEEYGLLGVIAVCVCLAVLVTRTLKSAIAHSSRPFYALMVTGISGLIALQSLLILGGTLRLVPLTGVTLPFVSYGGSSLLTSFIMVGLLLRLSEPSRP
jgi:cell division protein FtsW